MQVIYNTVVHDVGATDQMLPVYFLCVYLYFLQVQRTILEVLVPELFFEELVQGLVQGVSDEVGYWIEIGNFAYDVVDDVSKHTNLYYMLVCKSNQFTSVQE